MARETTFAVNFILAAISTTATGGHASGVARETTRARLVVSAVTGTTVTGASGSAPEEANPKCAAREATGVEGIVLVAATIIGATLLDVLVNVGGRKQARF